MSATATPSTGSQALVATVESRLGPLPVPLRAAFLAVDRARFVRPCDVAYAYEDWPLPLDSPHGAAVPSMAELLARHGDNWIAALMAPEFRASGATISAPIVYALAFRVLGLAAGQRLLELGSGTGYGAALAAHVVGTTGRVTTVDVDPHLVAATRANTADLAQVTAFHDDGLERADLMVDHDRAWLTFSVAEPPSALANALPEGAFLLAPVGPPPPAAQRWLGFRRVDGVVVEAPQPSPVQFIPARPLVR